MKSKIIPFVTGCRKIFFVSNLFIFNKIYSTDNLNSGFFKNKNINNSIFIENNSREQNNIISSNDKNINLIKNNINKNFFKVDNCNSINNLINDEKRYFNDKNIDNNKTNKKKRNENFNTKKILEKSFYLFYEEIVRFVNKKIDNIFTSEVKKKIFVKKFIKAINMHDLFEDRENYLKKTIGEILSKEFDTEHTYLTKDYNKKVMDYIQKPENYNKENEAYSTYFKNLSEITFVQCINYCNNNTLVNINVLLNGMNKTNGIIEHLSYMQGGLSDEYRENIEFCMEYIISFLKKSRAGKNKRKNIKKDNNKEKDNN